MIQKSFCQITSDNPDTYKKVRKEVDAQLLRQLNDPKHFQSINEREERSDIPLECLKTNYKGRYFVTYKGCKHVANCSYVLPEISSLCEHFLRCHTNLPDKITPDYLSQALSSPQSLTLITFHT